MSASPMLHVTRPRQSKSISTIVVQPAFAALAARLGLTSAEDFLDLPGEVVSGHRDRHVVAVKIGSVRAFLKKEHRVPFRIRWRNWRDGYGWSSLAYREARTISSLRTAGVPVPELLAYGNAKDGRSFVLLRKVRSAVALSNALLSGQCSDFERWQLARNLGIAIARLHRAGFTSPDLSKKHVLVRLRDRGVVLLDWQRATRRNVLSQTQTLRPLAAIHASLPLNSTTVRERLLVLKTFLRTLGFRCNVAPVARQTIKIAAQLMSCRSIREQVDGKLLGAQRLRWIDGERLCVTRPLWTALNGICPDWLFDAARHQSSTTTIRHSRSASVGSNWLIHFPKVRFWKRWLTAITRTPARSLALQQSGLAFRLQRLRIPVCPVSAFGGQADGSGFLLIQSPAKWWRLRDWVTLVRPERRQIIRQVGRLVRRCHEAGCHRIRGTSLIVGTNKQGQPRIRLVPDGTLAHVHQISHRKGVIELRSLARQLGLNKGNDWLRLKRAYDESIRRTTRFDLTRKLPSLLRRAA